MTGYSVYCHISPNGKRYVGITSTNPEKRWRNGRGYENNFHFYRAIQKYGWDAFDHVILHSDLSREDAIRTEIDLIEAWNLTDRRYGYNLRDGGDGSFSEESRKKMSLSRIGNKNSAGITLSSETRKKISESLKSYYSEHPGTFTGRRHSEAVVQALKNRSYSNETRERMSKNHADVSGAKNPSARKVVQLSEDGEIIARYSYAKEASDKLSVDLSAIIACCRGRKKTCGGFRWRYEEDVA